MSLTQQLLLKLSTFQLGLIAVSLSVLITILTVIFVNWLSLSYQEKKYNQATVIIFGGLIIVYGILLASVLFSTWQDFKYTDLNVRKEANSVIELYRATEAFLPGIKEEMRILLKQYTESIIHDEWPRLARSELNPRTTEIAKKMWSAYTGYLPKNETEQIFLQESIRKLSELRELRSNRLIDSKTGVHVMLWLVMIIGEIVTVASIAFFMEDLRTKMTITIIFSILVGLIFFMIFLYDYPFTGELFIVSPEPLRQAMLYW